MAGRRYLRDFYNWRYLSSWRAPVRVPEKYRPWLEDRLRTASPTRIGRWRHGPAGVAWSYLGIMVVLDAARVVEVLLGLAIVAFGAARLVICWRFAIWAGCRVLEEVASRNDFEYVTAGHIEAVARVQTERMPFHEARVQMVEEHQARSRSAYGSPSPLRDAPGEG